MSRPIPVTAATCAIYVVSFPLLHRLMAESAGILAVIPAFVGAWLLGLRGGVVVGLLTIPMISLGWMLTDSPLSAFTSQHGSYIGSLATLGVAVLVGWMRDLMTSLSLAREEAERAGRARGVFLATMSHEIRTPMNGVLGFSELLLSDDSLAPAHREQVQIIHDSARGLLILLNDILDLSRLEASQVELEAAPLDLAGLVSQTLQIFSVQSSRNAVVLSVGYHAGTPRVVTGDAARIRQVLVNLIGNAVKFTRDGIVRVSVRRTSPIRIEVIDTGIGIAPEEQERIFGQFSQANASVSRRFGGTGLGLAICRRLVEAMGGEIGVISQTEPPSGSTFWLTLPLTASTLPAASAPDTRPLLRLDWPILVVDDHPINRRLVRHMLENQGIAVVLAESGEEALERVSEQRFAAVLMDCMMPGLDGMETTRRMRALGHTLPIIALTASAMAEDQRRCLESGMSDHVAKPIDTTTLLGVLGRYLGQPTVSTG